MISVIIPTYNEAENIGELVSSIFAFAKGTAIEVIVADAGSTDNTLNYAQAAGAAAVVAPGKGRAAQMNYGASVAKGDIFYFVHADAQLHKDFAKHILLYMDKGFDLGCYRLKLDSKNPLLRINSFFTRFPYIWCRGGDQTLFIKRSVFNELNGFADIVIMEDYDLLKRAKEKGYRFKIIPEYVVSSARKYATNNYFRVLKANYTVIKLWKKGKATDKEMAALYKKLLDYR